MIVFKSVRSPCELNAIFVANPDNVFTNIEIPTETIANKVELNTIKKSRFFIDILNIQNIDFTCSNCSVGFTNPEILKHHQSFYCKEVIQSKQQSPTTSTSSFDQENKINTTTCSQNSEINLNKNGKLRDCPVMNVMKTIFKRKNNYNNNNFYWVGE